MDNLKTLQTANLDYVRVTQALAYLDAHWQERPDLAQLAARCGLGPDQFHRIFARWTGTSAKRLVDALAHDQARKALLRGSSVLDAALDAGFSGPSRLHDLFLAFEAVTPGEAKRRGEGLQFTQGIAPTPFGLGVFLIAPRGLSALGFVEDGQEAQGFADFAARYPAAIRVRDDEVAAAWATKIFITHERTPLALYGTKWQRQVWRALLAIPDAGTVTYGQLAAYLGDKKAARAVGTAVGRNPVSWLIPCHRVLGKDGRLTGYHWGVDRKRSMLAWEMANQ
ncbi:ADA regulatory protein / Methylated-DNA--protein-cysteine methyltransferase [hydrothermal vent metagenome]|uniref:methylated-DNA--[protein]-cysteine S-methyltransferase n=1 Tax=hydrothermal vent metagenome TaxID=652676 RepID=A0A3B0S039_9ZZZZ